MVSCYYGTVSTEYGDHAVITLVSLLSEEILQEGFAKLRVYTAFTICIPEDLVTTKRYVKGKTVYIIVQREKLHRKEIFKNEGRGTLLSGFKAKLPAVIELGRLKSINDDIKFSFGQQYSGGLVFVCKDFG